MVFGVRSCLSTQVWNKIERMMARDLILRLSGLKRFQQARQTAWLYVINQVFLMFRNAREGRTGPLYKENRQILDVNIFVSSFGFCGLSTYLSMICWICSNVEIFTVFFHCCLFFVKATNHVLFLSVHWGLVNACLNHGDGNSITFSAVLETVHVWMNALEHLKMRINIPTNKGINFAWWLRVQKSDDCSCTERMHLIHTSFVI